MSKPSDIEKVTRQYRRLAISIQDLLDAHRFASYVVEQELHEQYQEAKIVLEAFTLAMVVSYSRPFLNSSGDGPWPTTSRVQERILRRLTPDQAKLHERILALRSEEVAHSDAASHDAKLSLRTPPNGSAERLGFVVQRATGQPFSLDETVRFRELVSSILGAALAHRKELEEKLPDAEHF